MTSVPRKEHTFLIPKCRGSDRVVHPTSAWEWLDDELIVHFAALSRIRPTVEGEYTSRRTGRREPDECVVYFLALTEAESDQLRAVLRRACVVFDQECVYLSVGGNVEFIDHPDTLPVAAG